jgi:TonB-linked SusC/RagA family outer membrane protein
MFADWSARYSSRAVALLTAVLGAWLLVGAGAVHAQQGAVAGTVTDSETLQPVAGAQVFIPGTVVGTLTGERGTYRLEGVPAGEVTVTVRLIGYREISLTVTVAGGQVATADFSVVQTALRLQDIIVTGVVASTPRVKLPFTVERLDAQDIPVPTANVASLLAGKAAGVSVVRATGQPGEAADVTLRGPTSIDASGRTQGPLIVIDGVAQSANATLADIGALDVDHVEIVKGAAAASLYGARAGAGVIQITTKRGTALATNTFQVAVRGEYGLNQIENSIELTNAHFYKMTADGTQFLGSDAGVDVPVSDFTNLSRPGFPASQFDDDFTNIEGESGTVQTVFADNPWPVSFDHIKEFFDPGQTFSVYGAVTGRFGESSFRVSFEEFKESGVVSCSTCESNLAALNSERAGQGLDPFNPQTVNDEGYERQNARLNVDTRFGDIDLAASGFYSRSSQDDAAQTNGSFFALTFMSPGIDLAKVDPEDGLPIIDIDPLSAEENPLYQLAIGDSYDYRTRTMASFDANWAPVDWFSLEANAAFDRTDFESVDLRTKNEKNSEGGFNTFTGGSLDTNNWTDESVGASVTASYNNAFMDGDLTVRAKARYVGESQEFNENGVEADNFVVDGVPTFGALEQQTTEGNRTIREIKGQGYFGIGSLDYKGKYILDGLVRRDGSSLFGPDERWATYFRGSAAWRIAQEDWFNVGFIDEFKLRFSLGTAGGRPRFSAQYETFDVGSGRITPTNLGNKALKPEFSTEREAGVNLVMFEKIGIDYTYAWQDTEDQLLPVPQASFAGFQSQWQNAGTITAKTHEVSVRWAAIDNQDVGLNFRANWDRTTNLITKLDVAPYRNPDGAFFIAENRPLGELWGKVWATSCADLAPVGISASDCASNFQVNDDDHLVFVGAGNSWQDGISKGLWGTSGDVGDESYTWGFPIAVLDKSPICVAANNGDPNDECDLVEYLPMGNTTPDWNASFATNFRYKGLSINTLLDASVGMDIYNNTRQWPLRELRGSEVSQLGKSEATKKPVGYTSEFYNVNDENSRFIEKGDWLKLRELAVGYSLPQSTLQSLFKGAVDRVTISFIGRNLLTITNYTGYDPEVGFSGSDLGSASIGRTDRFDYPNFRTFTGAVEIVF